MYGRASSMTESAVVTTTATSATSPAAASGGRMQPLGEGRKAARRRSRASRKTPTTVLNTDTTNFRALVQQFTGGPTRPFQAAFPIMADGVGGGAPATLSFGLPGAATQFHQQPAVFPLGVQQQLYQPYPQLQQHHERSVFVPGGNGRSGTGSAGDDIYLSRFHSSNPERDSTEDVGDGLLLERISSSQLFPRPAPSTGSSTTDRFLL